MKCKWTKIPDDLETKEDVFINCKNNTQVVIYENVVAGFKYCPYCGKKIISNAQHK